MHKVDAKVKKRMNLEAIALKNVLSRASENDATKSVVVEFLESWLTSNPEVLTRILARRTLYHVFFRERDNNRPDAEVGDSMGLVATFPTREAANDFIMARGKEIVDGQEDNRDRPIVMCIVPFDNEMYQDPGSEPRGFMVASRRYPTFAFTKKGYKMALKEHKRAVLQGDLQGLDVIPWWITFVTCANGGTKITKGCPREHIEKISKHYENANFQEFLLDTYESFSKATESYIQSQEFDRTWWGDPIHTYYHD